MRSYKNVPVCEITCVSDGVSKLTPHRTCKRLFDHLQAGSVYIELAEDPDDQQQPLPHARAAVKRELRIGTPYPMTLSEFDAFNAAGSAQGDSTYCRNVLLQGA